MYSVGFDTATIARLTAMMEAAPLMAVQYSAAMQACVNKVKAEAQARAPVRSIGGGGTLRRGIEGHVLSPLRGVVGVGYQVPYARRRESGFSGMTDSLGRYYANDPGRFYLRDGLEASLPFIEAAFRTAAALSVVDMSAGRIP